MIAGSVALSSIICGTTLGLIPGLLVCICSGREVVILIGKSGDEDVLGHYAGSRLAFQNRRTLQRTLSSDICTAIYQPVRAMAPALGGNRTYVIFSQHHWSSSTLPYTSVHSFDASIAMLSLHGNGITA